MTIFSTGNSILAQTNEIVLCEELLYRGTLNDVSCVGFLISFCRVRLHPNFCENVKKQKNYHKKRGTGTGLSKYLGKVIV